MTPTMIAQDLTLFTDADLDRLEELLDSDIFQGEAMLLDELQALLCALISGPQLVPPSVWLPVAFGEQPRFETPAQAKEVTELVMRFYNDLVHKLNNDEEWELILYPVDEDPEELDFATWAEAYLYGSQLGGNWYDAVGDHAEELTELLQPLFLLSGMLKEDAMERGEAWLSTPHEEAAIASAEEELPELIAEIHSFWRAKRASDAAIADEAALKPGARQTPAAGQEDCPCGSGQPYRQCCGRPEKLH